MVKHKIRCRRLLCVRLFQRLSEIHKFLFVHNNTKMSSSTTATIADQKMQEAAANNQMETLMTLIDQTLQSTQQRFETMSDSILKKMDEMSKRIDELEGQVSNAMKQLNNEGGDI